MYKSKASITNIVIVGCQNKEWWGSSWLNMFGRLILLKFFLSSLPLYHFTFLNALTIIHKKIEAFLRHFLWQGGKNEKKKYNLVTWRQATQNHENGGLDIRIPKVLNNAFGGKIGWRLISGQNLWWKQVLESKYLSSPQKNLLQQDIPSRPCSRIWVLCKKSTPFISRKISKFAQGGSNTNIWNDRIMGQAPLNSSPSTQ